MERKFRILAAFMAGRAQIGDNIKIECFCFENYAHSASGGESVRLTPDLRELKTVVVEITPSISVSCKLTMENNSAETIRRRQAEPDASERTMLIEGVITDIGPGTTERHENQHDEYWTITGKSKIL